MSSSPFLPLPTGLEIVSIETVEDLLRVHVASTKQRASCPLCHCPTERRHSHYTRVVADLPCAGFRVQLILHVRKFFCDAVDCARRIFDLSASSLCRTLGTGDGSPASSLGSRWDSHLWRGRHTACRAAGPTDFSYYSPSPDHGLAHRGGRTHELRNEIVEEFMADRVSERYAEQDAALVRSSRSRGMESEKGRR
jgi:transposase